MTGARLFRLMQRSGRIAGLEFDFSEMPCDRRRRPLETEANVTRKRLGVETTRPSTSPRRESTVPRS